MASLARLQPCRLSPARHFGALGAVLAALWAFPAVAQAPQGKPQPAPNSVLLKRSDCTRLTAHVPSVDATYQPGVDVHGRAVAPADLAGTPQIAMPEDITINITVELQQRFGIPVTSNLYKPEAGIGTVVVKPDGSATFNGQPLTNQEQSALAFLCQRQGPLGR
jgi:hypothetical protein